MMTMLSITCTGIAISLFALYLGRLLERWDALGQKPGDDPLASKDTFPENIMIYRIIARRQVESKFRLIPKAQRTELENLWARSGRKPNEFMYYVTKLEIFLLGVVLVFLLIALLTGSIGFGVFLALPLGLYWLLMFYQFKDEVANRLQQIERELPYSLDLLAMMLYGGGNVFVAFQSLSTLAVRTPLNDELRAVTGALRMGRSLTHALRTFGDRIGSESVKSVVLAVEQGERLGTPLHEVLRTQARTIRSRRILAAEEQAQSAGVKVFIPASLVMLALMIIMLAPSIMKLFG